MVTPAPNPKSKPNLRSKDKDKDKDKGVKGSSDSQSSEVINEDAVESDKQTTIDNDNEVQASTCDNHDNTEPSMHNQTSENNSDLRDEASDASTQTDNDALLQVLSDMKLQMNKLEGALYEPKNGILVQLAKTTARTQELHTDIHGKVGGLLVQLNSLSGKASANELKITQMEASQKRILSLLEDNKRLRQELLMMQGVVQKLSQQSKHNANNLLDLTKRGMEQNLVLHRVDDQVERSDPKRKEPMFKLKERPKQDAINFFTTVMNLDITTEDVWKAHRISPYKQDKVRPMVVKLSYPAKDLIMEHLSTLKGQKNPSTKQVYFISEQVPDGITEVKKQTSARVKTLQDANATKPDHEKDKIQVFQDKVLVNGVLDVPEVQPPQPAQLFLDVEAQSRVDVIQSKMMETDPVTVKNSEFRALALKVHSIQEVNDAYIAAAQHFPSADHIMVAYAFKQDHKLFHGACDDREFGASAKIKNTPFENQAKNTAIFIIRKYGGIHLGTERFRTISEVALQALNMLPR